MLTKRGRPTVIDRLWRYINNNFLNNSEGSKYPLTVRYNPASVDLSAHDRYYDQEVYGWVIRNPEINVPLVDMVQNCPEVKLSINRIQDAIWGSHEGENGFTVSQFLDDDETPIDPEVYDILMDVQDRLVGRSRLKPVTREMLQYGDCFMSIGVDYRKAEIVSLNELPTFEMFRVEDIKGRVLLYQQRHTTADSRTAINFHPMLCVHWRLNRKWGNKYGTPLFDVALNDWRRLQQADEDLAKGANAVAINPLIHGLPLEYDMDDIQGYKRVVEEQRGMGTITDWYPPPGADLHPAYSSTPSLDGLIDNFKLRCDRILDQSSVPSYLLGREISGAKEIGEQPAMAFARLVNSVRNDFTGLGQPGYDSGIRHLFNLALALKGIPKERWLYRIIFPPAYTSVYFGQQGLSNETNEEGIDDLSAVSNPSQWNGSGLPVNLLNVEDEAWGEVPMDIRERITKSLS